MGAKAVDSLGNMYAAKRLAPGNRIGLVARLNGQGVRGLGPSSDEPVYLLLNVDERLLHNTVRVGAWAIQGKRRKSRVWAN